MIPDPGDDLLESCPFIGCSSSPTLVTEPRAYGPQAGISAMIRRIPQHVTGGQEWFGLCPASLMEWPLGTAQWNTLRDQGRTFARMHDDRRAREIPRAAPAQHSKTPRPDPNPGPMWQQRGRR